MFQRPEIKNNDAHDAGRRQVRSGQAVQIHRVSYNGKVCMLKDPLEMADPARAFKSNPYSRAKLEIDYSRVTRMGRRTAREKRHDWVSPKPSGDPEAQFAKGHLEQLAALLESWCIR